MFTVVECIKCICFDLGVRYLTQELIRDESAGDIYPDMTGHNITAGCSPASLGVWFILDDSDSHDFHQISMFSTTAVASKCVDAGWVDG